MKNEYLNNRELEKYICLFQQTKKDKTKYEMFLTEIKECLLINERKIPETWNKINPLYDQTLLDFEKYEQWLTNAFCKLSQNLAGSKRFRFIDIDDAIQEGIIICFLKLDGFVQGRGKAFSYMTTCVLNHFKQMYRSARNYNEFKKKYQNYYEIKYEDNLVSSLGSQRQRKPKNSSKYSNKS